MRIVLSGATGYVGGAVLSQCLKHPSITSVLVLTRRDPGNLPADPKVKVIIVKDFTSYEESVVDELKTADAAIWCLGTYNGNEKVDIEFPLAFINAIKSRPSGPGGFRYVQLGGAFTEPPPKEGQQERSLWFLAHARRVRGAVETNVLEAADASSEGGFAVYLVKPAAILSWGGAILQYILGSSLCIAMNELTVTMVDLAVHGNDQNVFLNQDIVKHAKKLLEKST